MLSLAAGYPVCMGLGGGIWRLASWKDLRLVGKSLYFPPYSLPLVKA